MAQARMCQEIALDALDWTKLIQPGDMVVWSQASAEPVGLTAGLMSARAGLGGFRAFVGIGCGQSTDPAFTDHVSFSSYCGTGTNHILGDRLDILPLAYSELAPCIGKETPVVLLSVAPGSDAEHFSYGAAGDYTADLISRARLVIAEVNSNMPRTGTGKELRRSQIDILCRSHHNPLEPNAARIGEAEEAIARSCAALIEDGSTLQIGLGAVPSAVLRLLTQHKDIGIHSGLIGDETLLLAESGALTNAQKPIDTGVSVAGILIGSQKLMRWADRNPALAIKPTSYTHNPSLLASIDRLVAINSAVEVDLTGQVNAEVAGGRYVGAVGGAGAFLRGAHASRGGLPIIALPATAGSASRIVASLSGPVSTPRADAGLIITEHGVADLRGLSLRRRRDAMLSIAAPCHQDALDAAIN